MCLFQSKANLVRCAQTRAVERASDGSIDVPIPKTKGNLEKERKKERKKARKQE